MRVLILILVGLLALVVETATAATVYVDPSCTNNGDGTATACAGAPAGAGPYNTWASVTFADGNTYAQNRGTTFIGQVTIAASGVSATSRITMDAYGSGAAPIIDGTGNQFGIYIDGARSHITVQNYEVFGVNSGGSADRFLVRLCNGVGSECTDIALANLVLHDPVDPGGVYEANGIWGYCADCTFDNLTIYNIPSDGIWLANVGNFTIKNSYIHTVATSGRSTGDNVQLGGTLTSLTVTDNIFDHRNTEAKQVFLDITTGGTSGLIRGNQFLMSIAGDQQAPGVTQALSLTTANVRIESNVIYGAWRGLVVGGSGAVIVGNYLYGSYGSLYLQAGNSLSTTMINNTFDGRGTSGVTGVNASGTGYAVTMQNNVLAGLATGISKGGTGTITETYNNFFGNTANGVTLHGSDLTSNPLLLSDGRTQATSPLRRAGTAYGSCRDARGRVCWSPPDIGAYQSTSGDPAATRAVRN